MGVCIAVRNDGADITGDAEALKDCFVKRNVTVLRTHERSIDIEKHQPFHDASEYSHNPELLRKPRGSGFVSRKTVDKPSLLIYKTARVCATGVNVESTTRECRALRRPNAWVSYIKEVQAFFCAHCGQTARKVVNPSSWRLFLHAPPVMH